MQQHHLQRGILLYQQQRYDLALEQFQQALSADPQSADAHAYAALCLMKQNRLREATDAVAQAIQSEPDSPFSHYAAALIFHQRNHQDKAYEAIQEAIRLNPAVPDFYGVAGLVRMNQRDWSGALEQATKGLEIDPEDSLCTNVRAMALVRLGQSHDAREELRTSLSRDPEDAFTHANLGWAALHRGQRKQAMESFREALRLDPQFDWARAGMIQAIKAGYPLYGLLLRYFLWMASLSRTAQWGVIIGLYVAFRIVRGVARANPDMQPWLLPLIVAYVAFCYLTWTARPVTTLILRLNRFGRAILTPVERLESNLVGLALLGAAACGIGYLWVGSEALLPSALVCAVLVVPISGTFSCDRGRPRNIMAAITVSLVALGAGGVLLATAANNWLLLTLFFLGAVASLWIANILAGMEVKQ